MLSGCLIFKEVKRMDIQAKTALLEQIGNAVEKGNAKAAVPLVKEALSSIDPREILDVLQVRMKKVGNLFEHQVLFLPELYIAAMAMQACSNVLQPELAKLGGDKRKGKIVLGTVENDVHDIGKNIVRTVLEANGFEIFDIGVNCPARRFLEKALEFRADIVAMSSLLTTSMPEIVKIIELLRKEMKEPFRTLVGGAPVTQAFADRVGANGFAPDAFGAVKVATELVSNKQMALKS
jgi:methanogenic corrinoid protein MtbC1